jgi:hypothetical protein
MNILSLLFCGVSLLLKFFSLLIFSSFLTRNAYGCWASDNLAAYFRLFSRFFPVFFPDILTAHTTKHSNEINKLD